MGDDNETTEDDEHSKSVPLQACGFVAYLVVWLLSIFGNTLVCIVIRRSRRVQSTTNFFVIGISVADIVYSLIAMPFVGGNILVGQWEFGDFMCRLLRLVQYASPGVVMLILLCISVDRFYTIIYPLSFKVKRKTAKQMIIGCWAVGYICCCFCLFIFEQRDSKRGLKCGTFARRDDWVGIGFSVSIVVLQYFVLATIMCYLYARVWRFIWRRGGGGSMRIQRTENHVSSTKVNIVKMLMVITAATLVLLVPYYTSLLWYGIHRPVHEPRGVYLVVTWFVFCAGVIRPVLYMFYNANFRRGCKEVICLSHSRCYRSNNYAITNAMPLGKHNHVGVLPNGLDSPSKVFDRSLGDQSQWPFQNNNISSSSYL